jgi:hypothetical protein
MLNQLILRKVIESEDIRNVIDQFLGGYYAPVIITDFMEAWMRLPYIYKRRTGKTFDDDVLSKTFNNYRSMIYDTITSKRPIDENMKYLCVAFSFMESSDDTNVDTYLDVLTGVSK